MLAVCLATQSFSAPTAQVAQPVIRASAYVSPVQISTRGLFSYDRRRGIMKGIIVCNG